jgi:hypothetical protein
MRGLRSRTTKLINLNHRLPPWHHCRSYSEIARTDCWRHSLLASFYRHTHIPGIHRWNRHICAKVGSTKAFSFGRFVIRVCVGYMAGAINRPELSRTSDTALASEDCCAGGPEHPDRRGAIDGFYWRSNAQVTVRVFRTPVFPFPRRWGMRQNSSLRRRTR